VFIARQLQKQSVHYQATGNTTVRPGLHQAQDNTGLPLSLTKVLTKSTMHTNLGLNLS